MCDQRERAAHRLLLDVSARQVSHPAWTALADGRTYPELLARLRGEPASVDEIGQVLQLGVDASRLSPGGLGEGLSDVPLSSHASYTRPEILAAFGLADEDRSARGRQAGVEWARSHNAVLLLVNLRKDQADFSPTTMYRDNALGERRFHWESQNDTALDSRAGRELLDPATYGIAAAAAV